MVGTGIMGRPFVKPDGRAAKPGGKDWNIPTGSISGVVGNTGTGRPGERIIAHWGGTHIGMGAAGLSVGCGIAIAGFIIGKLGEKDGPLRNADAMKPIGIMGTMNTGGIAILLGPASEPGVAIPADITGFAKFGDGIGAGATDGTFESAADASGAEGAPASSPVSFMAIVLWPVVFGRSMDPVSRAWAV